MKIRSFDLKIGTGILKRIKRQAKRSRKGGNYGQSCRARVCFGDIAAVGTQRGRKSKRQNDLKEGTGLFRDG